MLPRMLLFPFPELIVLRPEVFGTRCESQLDIPGHRW